MKTISDSLVEIPILQKNILIEKKSQNILDSQFCDDILEYTTSYYYNMLAHSCLSNLNLNVDVFKLPKSYQQYISETSKDDNNIYKSIIMYQSIAGILICWNYFEQFIFRICKTRSENAGDFEKHHKNLLSTHIKRAKAKEIIHNFTGIRKTRNSIHNGGIYTSGSKNFSFTVKDTNYILIPGKRVAPIRILDLLDEMWRHYIILKEIKQPNI